jgi:hypothetical protein
VRLPTFSRQSETDTTATDERPATAPVRPRSEAATTTDLPAVPKHTADLPPAPKAAGRTGMPPTAKPDTLVTRPTSPAAPVPATTTTAGPKPRASLLATLGLILGVASVLLVLSGPLLGYGIGVAGLALVLSLAGVRATGKRHVAGKSDALLGMVLSLAAIVVGVLALTGSLSWLGTDMQPVSNLREWLDTQFVDRF